MKPAERDKLQALLPQIPLIEEAKEPTSATSLPVTKSSLVLNALPSLFPEPQTAISAISFERLPGNLGMSKINGTNTIRARMLSQVAGTGQDHHLKLLRSRDELRAWRRSASEASRKWHLFQPWE